MIMPIVREQSSCVWVISFYDETNALKLPIAATWTLTDSDGTVINGREDVPFPVVAPVINLVLNGADLAWTENSIRRLIIKSTYLSSVFGTLNNDDHIEFEIERQL